ncbi:hypothetical protein Dtox_0684 [Desulfofarcimen acetoxidans DSM 771]|uniref:Transposase (putative) YhgA-like domain-containing protein n=1 Tax=Desulfofarcimen acetoxidans (strain ATCC 49208 / DSM 771 / KCTC 5769 / VKM B-1644 / 5575) TaxID=485916 RepID=C8W1F3_DESAS|nr:hypothetical protein [Desulfofarcimen acetoxidans]ACV61598.1 hypothetical protein Dtox_0684 [Desulfofarcimen acetoxidans DSM 771]
MAEESNDAALVITRQNNDVIMKAVSQLFTDKTLSAIGLKTARIVSVMPTVLPVVEVKEKRIDFVFLLKDNSILHLEFQTTIPKDILIRMVTYGSRLVEKYDQDVNTVVIYSGKIESAPRLLRKGSLTYKVKNIYMKKFDGDAEYKRIYEKIKNKKPLDEIDIQRLIFLPLMKSKEKSEDEMAIQAAELAKEIPNEPIRAFTIGAIVAISDNFLTEEYKKRLLEVLRMTQIEQWIREEGREEGLKEGLKEGREEGLKEGLKEGLREGLEKTAIAALREGFDIETIVKITNLSKEEILSLKKKIH